MTLAELRFGIERVTDARRHANPNEWLDLRVRLMSSQRMLPVSIDLVLE